MPAARAAAANRSLMACAEEADDAVAPPLTLAGEPGWQSAAAAVCPPS